MAPDPLNPLWASPGPVGERCADCVWLTRRGVNRCRRHRNEPVAALSPACPAFTATLDCLTCGACCREAYHAVEVGARDPFARLHPEFIEVSADSGRRVVPRIPTATGTRCACLVDPSATPPDYRCVAYADRPRTCRDFEQGSVNCVEARRRVGLTV